MESTIYTIGHGNKSFDQFLTELRQYDIKYLIDVRSKPFSKWNPDFSKDNLAVLLARQDIRYVWMGDSIGGLPTGGSKDFTCYSYINGERHVDYSKIAQQEFFKQGLQRVIVANEKQLNVALMCSETRPEACHRSKLIGEELRKQGISIHHICDGKLYSQEFVMSIVTNGNPLTNLFGEDESFMSVKPH
ncbi:MAG: DUF488 domain-containing protein [Bacteroidales bacterium]|nr:DUF488 domain-containing protein [Bacteroidales bacterium]